MCPFEIPYPNPAMPKACTIAVLPEKISRMHLVLRAMPVLSRWKGGMVFTSNQNNIKVSVIFSFYSIVSYQITYPKNNCEY